MERQRLSPDQATHTECRTCRGMQFPSRETRSLISVERYRVLESTFTDNGMCPSLRDAAILPNPSKLHLPWTQVWRNGRIKIQFLAYTNR